MQDLRVSKAVVPAAGLGTRFMPQTKAVPKEMLPLVDKPAIQYVVEEAVGAGLNDIAVVVGEGKQAIQEHFDRSYELETALTRLHAHSLLAQLHDLSQLAAMHYLRQATPNGVGHAVLTARTFAGGQPFAVFLPDEVIEPSARLLDRMLKARARYGGSVVALMRMHPTQLRDYGCAAVQPTADGEVVRIVGMVEKPAPGHAPSDLAVIGRFVLEPTVFAELDRTQPGHGGEIQLTDALDAMAQPEHDGGPIHGLVFDGRRYDTGSHVGHLQAMVEMACAHDDLGAPFRQWLTAFVATTR